MVLHLNGKSPGAGIEAWPARHGPGRENAAHLEAEVVVESSSPMAVDDEPAADLGGSPVAGRLGRDTDRLGRLSEVAPFPIPAEASSRPHEASRGAPAFWASPAAARGAAPVQDPEVLPVEAVVLVEEGLDLRQQRGRQVREPAGGSMGRRGFRDGDEAIVPDDLAVPFSLLDLEHPDQSDVNETTCRTGRIHQDEHVEWIAVLRSRVRQKTEVERKRHADRQHMAEPEGLPFSVEFQLVVTALGGLDDDLPSRRNRLRHDRSSLSPGRGRAQRAPTPANSLSSLRSANSRKPSWSGPTWCR